MALLERLEPLLHLGSARMSGSRAWPAARGRCGSAVAPAPRGFSLPAPP
jgi:hypothetical protein